MVSMRQRLGSQGQMGAGNDPDQREQAKPHFRADINGLRAVAIIPVVAFHAAVPGFGGGFIGVDIFFVISGYLITGNLLRQINSSGRISLGKFWAARLRRLAPALTLMIAVTLLVGLLVLSPLEWATLSQQAAAAATYLSNVLFPLQSTDYFAGSLSQSPLLHTWTLGVEEQFYLVWPALMIVICWFASLRNASRRTSLIVAFSVIFALSFLVSLWLTEFRPTWAFYSLPSRAWEFAGAGLLATIPIDRYLKARWARELIAWLGLAIVFAGIAFMDAHTPFPGTAALVPVAGALMLLAAGTPSTNRLPLVSRALEFAPFQWIGSRSYSWYLWHWPAIVFAMAAFRTQSWMLLTTAALVSLGVAALSRRYVEDRIRYDKRLISSSTLTFATMASAIAFTLVLCLGLGAAGHAKTSTAPLASFQAAKSSRTVTNCRDESMDRIRYCLSGDLAASRTVMLVGDSHAGQWQVALSDAAKAAGYRLITRWQSACPAIPIANLLNAQGVFDSSCVSYRNDTMRLIGLAHPTIVIVSDANSYLNRIVDIHGNPMTTAQQATRWGAAFASLVGDIRADGAIAASIEDNPQLSYDPDLCMTRLNGSAAVCSPSQYDALRSTTILRHAQAMVAAKLHITQRFSTVDKICKKGICRVMDGPAPVYSDEGHLSAAWTHSQVPALQAFIDAAMQNSHSSGAAY